MKNDLITNNKIFTVVSSLILDSYTPATPLDGPPVVINGTFPDFDFGVDFVVFFMSILNP